MDSTVEAGQKRKRYQPPEEELVVRIGGKIHHEKKEVHRASKRAKVFETQKVVKRLKDLRKKNEDTKAIESLEAELSSLKAIDHDLVGNSAFKSKILKDHTLRDNSDIKTALDKELSPTHLLVPAEPGTTLAKIQSRLLSSKILAAQVAASIESLKVLLNPALKQQNREKAQAEAAGANPTSERPSKILKQSTKRIEGKQQALDPRSALDEDGADLDSSVDDDAGWESGSINGDEGEGGALDDGWESGSIGSPGQGKRRLDLDVDEDESEDESGDSDSDGDSDSTGSELKVNPPRNNPNSARAAAGVTKNSKTASSSNKTQSTFLPSLSVGFVRGSDDSDWSDGEGQAGDMPKKNRRGQRARRAIWEKKFGHNANHKKKEDEERAAALAKKQAQRSPAGHTSRINTGSNAIHIAGAGPAPHHGPTIRGGQGHARRNNIPQQRQAVDGGWASRSAMGTVAAGQGQYASKTPAAKGARGDEKALHPSWEAKRKLKEKESAGIVPSQGTKIKF